MLGPHHRHVPGLFFFPVAQIGRFQECYIRCQRPPTPSPEEQLVPRLRHPAEKGIIQGLRFS